jgi:hypothetical protein
LLVGPIDGKGEEGESLSEREKTAALPRIELERGEGRVAKAGAGQGSARGDPFIGTRGEGSGGARWAPVRCTTPAFNAVQRRRRDRTSGVVPGKDTVKRRGRGGAKLSCAARGWARGQG